MIEVVLDSNILFAALISGKENIELNLPLWMNGKPLMEGLAKGAKMYSPRKRFLS